jgi:hypothetical protein
MTLSYLVDTDWAVHWLHSNERIRQRMLSRISNH